MIPFYLDVDGATHQTNFNTNYAANLRLVALTMRDDNGTARYSAAWVPNDGRAWEACHGFDEVHLLQFFNTWQARGFELKVLTSTETLFGAVMEQTQSGTRFAYDLTDGPTSTSGAAAPTWATAPGAVTADGTTGLTWTLVSSGSPAAWGTAKAYPAKALVIDANGCFQQATTAGTSGTVAPAWATARGATTVDGNTGLTWMLVSFGQPEQWSEDEYYARGELVTDANGNLQQAATAATLSNAVYENQQPISNLAPRAFAIYGATGASRRYAVVFEPCPENWAIRLWDTDDVATGVTRAFFEDLRYRPTLLTYAPEGYLVGVFRDDSIGANNWTASNALSPSALGATYASFAGRGLWPLSLSVNPMNDTFACVMVTTEASLPRQWSVSGADIADLSGTLDPLMRALMQSPRWPAVNHPRVVAVAIAYQQRLVFAKAYTWAEATYPLAQPTSLFRMASCSKPITSIAIGRLIQDGLLADTDTVSMIGLNPTPAGGAFPDGFDSITVDELRTHRSGLQPVNTDDATIAAAYGHPTPISIYESVAYSMTNATISAGFPSSTTLQVMYQNCNYQLLGLIVRTATGGLYTDYVRKSIFDPLGLTRPYVGASLHSQRDTLELQHHSSYPSSVGLNRVTPDPPYVGGGYGTGDAENYEGFEDWAISPVDYVAILRAVNVANLGNYPVLNAANIATMFTKIDPTGAHDDFTLGGLFWEATPAGVTMFAHDGSWSIGGLNIASWVISRSDGVSAAVFMNVDDPGPLGDFVWGGGWDQLQSILDRTNWASGGDLFPAFGIPALLAIQNTPGLPEGTIGTPYDAAITATGGVPPYKFAVSDGLLPRGLTLDPVSGAISGTPTRPRGTANFTIGATDSSPAVQAATATLSIKIV